MPHYTVQLGIMSFRNPLSKIYDILAPEEKRRGEKRLRASYARREGFPLRKEIRTC